MKETKAFTLIELLVVITIIGVLAALITGSFRTSQIRSRDAQRKNNVKTVADGLELYYHDNEIYPAAAADGRIIACGAGGNSPCDWGVDMLADDSGVLYVRLLPTDPSGYIYFYRTTATRDGFGVFARLENSQDQTCIAGNCTNPPATVPDCGTGLKCNYAVTSPTVIYSDL